MDVNRRKLTVDFLWQPQNFNEGKIECKQDADFYTENDKSSSSHFTPFLCMMYELFARAVKLQLTNDAFLKVAWLTIA